MPICWVPLLSWTTSRNSLIVVVNKALYSGKKLDHSLNNRNQVRCYGTMVWDNLFDSNKYICLETCEGDTIDLIPDQIKIGFIWHVLIKEDLRTLPYIKVTSGLEWNPKTVKHGKVSTKKIEMHLIH